MDLTLKNMDFLKVTNKWDRSSSIFYIIKNCYFTCLKIIMIVFIVIFKWYHFIIFKKKFLLWISCSFCICCYIFILLIINLLRDPVWDSFNSSILLFLLNKVFIFRLIIFIRYLKLKKYLQIKRNTTYNIYNYGRILW